MRMLKFPIYIFVLSSLLSSYISQVSPSEERCSGRKILTSINGRISDGLDNYTQYSRCEWLIDGTRVSRQSNPTVSVIMEAETQTEEEQVNIIEPCDPITPIDIGNFAPGTDSLDSDAEIENHERQLE